MNRSTLIREALRAKLETRELELRDRKGYEAVPGDPRELSGWESEAIWPEE
jgi:metal-responsive CopG/Arc/MetJ family transcriptional regulator